MKNIRSVLIHLEPQLLMDIESSFCSIFKINNQDDSYQQLTEKHVDLKDAVYIVNPNFNSADGNIFLDKEGATLLRASFFANLISHIPLDFDYDVKKYVHNHPLEKLLAKIAI